MNIVLVIFDSLRKDCLFGSPPWGNVHTPHLDAFAAESVTFTRAYPESLPTLPARRALYTGQRTYPFGDGDIRLKGDFVGAPGWGPIPEAQDTLAELLQQAGYRTSLISDVYHMFKPSKNFWRGFDQWTFLRGQEIDPHRSGPHLAKDRVSNCLPPSYRHKLNIAGFTNQTLMNIHDRPHEEDFFSPAIFRQASQWLQENTDAKNFFLVLESFDPHEPWLIPDHYRKLYLKQEGREQIWSAYGSTSRMGKYPLRRTQANYSGSVTQCDRWFGFFIEQMQLLGLLDSSMIVVTSDHGHSIGDFNYMGKTGYPSRPEVVDVPLMIRLPKAKHAGKFSSIFLQHHDIAAEILHQARVKPRQPLDGTAFLSRVLAGRPGHRRHVTVGWGSTPTVIIPRWWFNCKADGTGVLLHDFKTRNPFARNVADKHPQVVQKLFDQALADAGGSFPEWLVELAGNRADAPGCSVMAART